MRSLQASFAAALLLSSGVLLFGCAEGRSIEEEPNRCGDGRPRDGEECDDADENSDKKKDACRTDCRVAHCGDGVRDSGEECDDGNEELGDGCDDKCKTSYTCGDEVCDEKLRESCSVCADDCCPCGDGVCTLGEVCGVCPQDCCTECGNGALDPGEGCDDGNNDDGDGCSKGCTDEDGTPTCGNDLLEAPEICDDGNTTPNDGCGPDCKLEYVCGDAQCENDVGENCETCAEDCCPNCGDGLLNDFEECDGSVPASADTCTALCYAGGSPTCKASCLLDYATCEGELPVCGNGILECGEECDDTDVGGSSCDELGFDGGTLRCTSTCTIDTSDCGDVLYFYAENFDAGCPGGWTFAFPWECGAPFGGPGSAFSAPNVIATGLDGSYVDSASYGNNVATSPAFDLSNAVAPVVEFKVWHDLESSFDAVQIQTGTDGFSFGPIVSVTPVYGEDMGWTGLSGGWQTYTASLANQAGQPAVYLRFALMSDGSSSDGGAFIDDIRVFDPCGNDVADANEDCDGADLRSQTCDSLGYDGGDLACSAACDYDTSGCGALTTILPRQTFEVCPPSGWTLVGEWACGAPTSGPNSANSGVNVIATDLSGDYQTGWTYSTCYAQTPAFTVAGPSPTLSFFAWIRTENSYDGMHLEASSDGVNWALVDTVTPAYTDDSVGSSSAWDDTLTTWSPYYADLSAYDGQTIQLRFAFFSDGSGNYAGAYVDDVSVVPSVDEVPVVLAPVPAPSDVFVGDPFSLTVAQATIGPVTYSITASTNAGWLDLDAATGVLSGTPALADVGPVSVTIRARRVGDPSNFDEVTVAFDVVDAVYRQSFAACPGGFTFSGDWECGAPTQGPATAFSTPNCIGTNGYSNGRAWGSSVATSPVIDLSGTTAPQLSFMFWSNIEDNWDRTRLEISVDGGAYQVITNASPGYTTSSGGESGWADFTTWTEVAVSLTPYAGSSIQLRWSMFSDGSTTINGPYVDDIVIVDN